MNKITNNQQKRIFALLGTLGAVENRATIVPQFCGNRTEHTSELSSEEADDMIAFLENYTAIKTKNAAKTAPTKTPKRKYNNSTAANNMRRKILHILAMMGYTNGSGSFDYDRINAYIENIGSNNPDKAKLNYLTNAELATITTQIEQRYKKDIKTKY